MKGSRGFILGIVVFLALMFAVQYHLPRKYVWTPTFSHTDHQPFGCAVFDSMLSASFPDGYSVSGKTFYQLSQDTLNRKAVLAISRNLALGGVDTDALMDMAARGDKVMLVASLFSGYVEDTLKFHCTYSYYNALALKKYVAGLKARDSIYWVGDSTVYSKQLFRVYPQLCGSYFTKYDSLPVRILSEKDYSGHVEYEIADSSRNVYQRYHPPVAMVRSVGKGEIILVSTPLLFTNYGMLDGDNAVYLFRVLTSLKGLPVVRTQAYTGHAEMEQSPLRYLLSQPPLRWAVYLAMLAILLFMLFTARRRQRAIPVMQAPANKSLEFVKLIGTLYFQKKDHADLVHKKFTYLAEELRRTIQVDVEEVREDKQNFRRIAEKTGMDVEELAGFFREVRPILYGGRTLTGEEMKHYIDKMNEIINHIY